MNGEYRFLRTRDGVTSFASVTVELQPSSIYSVTSDNLIYNDSEELYNGFYNTALAEGVEIAARAHEQRGGEPQHVEIVKLHATLIDSRADAVRCATALATWKALGHSEDEVNVLFANGEWRVEF
ncbi:MAG: hypothetical protein M3441_10695 [Chloroflexota bacterium]|nr:hypothetical protein [Chloroflexota bacterium]